MGSSTVTICSGLVRLMMSMSDANVVDFPEPVGPVTSTRPRRRSVNAFTASGIPRESNSGISWGMGRRAAAMVPRCSDTLTRNRPTPLIECDVSSSRSSSKRSRCEAGRIPNTMSRICSLPRTGQPSIGRMAPCSGWRPAGTPSCGGRKRRRPPHTAAGRRCAAACSRNQLHRNPACKSRSTSGAPRGREQDCWQVDQWRPMERARRSVENRQGLPAARKMTVGSDSTGLTRKPTLEARESTSSCDGGSEKATARTLPSNWRANASNC